MTDGVKSKRSCSENKQTNERTKERMIGRTNQQTNGRTTNRMNRIMDDGREWQQPMTKGLNDGQHVYISSDIASDLRLQ
jgi:hypothetical protein